MTPDANTYFMELTNLLAKKNIHTSVSGELFVCSAGKRKTTLSLQFIEELSPEQLSKIPAQLQSRLGLNQRVFARNCQVKKITKEEAANFLDRYHLMGSTQNAFNYGLFQNDELLAVASFSKGRKMNRLPEDKRSFELIRFCCKDGITVTGGLTKLVKNFCREKEAGDVMTYVDQRFSDGTSFIRAGFARHSATERNIKLVYKP
jgi:hypothetical protein